MSDPKKTEPDEDLLEFLGGIDEVNDESRDDDFSDYLARTDIEKVVKEREKKPQPTPPPKDAKHE